MGRESSRLIRRDVGRVTVYRASGASENVGRSSDGITIPLAANNRVVRQIKVLSVSSLSLDFYLVLLALHQIQPNCIRTRINAWTRSRAHICLPDPGSTGATWCEDIHLGDTQHDAERKRNGARTEQQDKQTRFVPSPIPSRPSRFQALFSCS